MDVNKSVSPLSVHDDLEFYNHMIVPRREEASIGLKIRRALFDWRTICAAVFMVAIIIGASMYSGFQELPRTDGGDEPQVLVWDMNIYIDKEDGRYYGAKALSVQLSFPRTPQSSVLVSNRELEISYEITDMLKGPNNGESVKRVEGIVDGNTITYPEAFNGMDIQYRVCANGLKQLLILNEYPRYLSGDLVLRGQLQYPPSRYNPISHEDQALGDPIDTSGLVSFYDNHYTEVLRIAPPVAYDTPGSRSMEVETRATTVPIISDDHRDFVTGRTELEENEDGARLVTRIPYEFLTAPTTTYPVYIDPTLTSPITDDVWYNDTMVYLISNLEISSGGRLNLYNATLQVNCTYTNEYNIVVHPNAEFNVYNSVVRPKETNKQFQFNTSGKVVVQDSSLNFTYSGINVSAGNTSLRHATIHNSTVDGVYVSGGNVTIYDSTIRDCGDDGCDARDATVDILRSEIRSNSGVGVWCSNVSGNISESDVSENSLGGVICSGSSNLNIADSSVHDNQAIGVSYSSSVGVVNGVEILDNMDGVNISSCSATTLISSCTISSNTANGLNIVGSSPTLMDNVIEDHTSGIGLYLNSSCPSSTNNEIKNNMIGVRAATGENEIDGLDIKDSGTTGVIAEYGNLTLSNSSIESSGDYAIEVGNYSNITTINSYFNKASTTVDVNGNALTVRWFLDVLVLSELDTPAMACWVNITDKQSSSVFSGQTNATGQIPTIILTEFVKTQGTLTMKTPHAISVEVATAHFYMGVSRELVLYKTEGDADGDLVIDVLEDQHNLTWYEAEGHIFGGSQVITDGLAMNGKAVTTFGATGKIINPDTFNDVFSINDYRVMVKAKSTVEGDEIVLVVSNGPELANETYPLSSDYHWYLTPWFNLASQSSLSISVNGSDDASGEIRIDRIGVVPKSIGMTRACVEGQITDVASEDSDYDNLLDGDERRNGTVWFEAEHCTILPNSVIYNYTFSNGQAVELQNTDSLILNLDSLLQSSTIQGPMEEGHYVILVRANMSEGAEDTGDVAPNWQGVILQTLSSITVIDQNLTWYRLLDLWIDPSETSPFPSISFTITSEMGEYVVIDKIGVALIVDDPDNLWTNSSTSGTVRQDTTPAVDDNCVVVTAWDSSAPNDAHIVYLDNSGQILWSNSSQAIRVTSPVVVDEGILYALYDSSGQCIIRLVDRSDGSDVWMTSYGYGLGYPTLLGLAVMEDQVIYAEASSVRSFSLSDGTPIWTYTPGVSLVIAPPVVYGDYVVLVETNQLRLLNSTGATMWTFSFGLLGTPVGAPAVANGKVFMSFTWNGQPSTYDYVVAIALDPDSAPTSLLWYYQIPANKVVVTEPIVGDDSVIVLIEPIPNPTFVHEVYRISEQSGSLAWQTPPASPLSNRVLSRSPCFVDDRIYYLVTNDDEPFGFGVDVWLRCVDVNASVNEPTNPVVFDRALLTLWLQEVGFGTPVLGDIDDDGYQEVIFNLDDYTFCHEGGGVWYVNAAAWQMFRHDQECSGSANYDLRYYTLDPDDLDMEHDGLRDGLEVFAMSRAERFDFEDMTNWSVAYMGSGFPAEASGNTKNVMYFHQTGAMLTTVKWGYDDKIPSADKCDSWVEVSFNVTRTGQYEIDIVPLNNFEDKSRDFCVRGGGMGEGLASNGGDGYAYLSSRKGDGMGDAVSGPLWSIDAEYLAKLIKNATYINLSCDPSGGSSERCQIPYDLPDEYFKARPTGIKNPVEHLDHTYIQGYFGAKLVTTLSAHTEYQLRVGVDIDRISQDLWDDQPFEGDIARIDLLDVDFGLVMRRGVQPFEPDSDGDSLADGIEQEEGYFPLRADADEDGLSDARERENGTLPGLRDTDFDGLRDRTELGSEKTDDDPYTIWDSTPSMASLWEMMMRNCDGEPTSLSSSTNRSFPNWDADTSDTTDPNNPDSDFDGLPDGAIDGWWYNPDANSMEQYTSQSTNLYLYKEAFERPYMRDYWGFTGTADNIVHVWEGEDFNLTGKVESVFIPWGFETSHPVGKRTGTEETDPTEEDSDSDGLPDGYEALYSQDAPLMVDNGGSPDYAFNPLNPQDGSWDKDVDLIACATTEMVNGYVDMDIDDYQAYAMRYVPATDIVLEEISVQIVVLTSEPKADTYELEIFDCNFQSGLSNRENRIRWTTASTDGINGTYFFRRLSVVLEENDIYWFVIRYRHAPFGLGVNTTAGGYTTAHYLSDGWHAGPGYPINMTLYSVGVGGDDLTNVEEYAAGTHPKRGNTDMVLRQNVLYDDLLDDGKECNWTLRSNAENGSFWYHGYLNATTIEYDGDSNGTLWGAYAYTRTDGEDIYDNPGSGFPGAGLDVIKIYELGDGTQIVLNQTSGGGSTPAIYVWEPGSDYLGKKEFDNGTEYYEGQCIKFTRQGGPYTAATYRPTLSYRYSLLFLSNPFDVDTDDDGLLDGVEVMWWKDCNQAGAEGDTGKDTLNNARDRDSDNDGLEDMEEPLFNQDMVVDRIYILDDDTLENMVDHDSDGDNITDGNELHGFNDTDGDGHINILDVDSDNDTLVDGFVDKVKWFSSGGVFKFWAQTSPGVPNEYDEWEGEDNNGNGRFDRDEYETDPLCNDTDGDGLLDGPGEGSNGIFGELTNHLLLFRGDYAYSGTNKTNKTNPDTDGDGLTDGQEIYGWTLDIKLPTGVNTSTWSEQFYASDPTWDDSDNDGLNDSLEYLFTNPWLADTDGDGWDDTDEDSDQDGNIDAGETNPRDADSDGDRLPDGFVLQDWGYGSFYWGEDKNRDGDWDGRANDEPNPMDPDSDGDMIPDGAEFNISYKNDSTKGGFCDVDNDGDVSMWDVDSDNDGLFDWEENCDVGWEALFWYNDSTESNETDPLHVDTDGDGLYDGAEPGRQSDPDNDGKPNAHDVDSNSKTDSDGQDNDQTFVVFRTNADYSTTTMVHDYKDASVWISVDTNVSIYNNSAVGQDHNLSLVWSNAGYKYDGNATSEPGGYSKIVIHKRWYGGAYEEPVDLVTPERYGLYVNSAGTIMMKVPGSPTEYLFFNKSGSEPGDYSDSKHNILSFVYNRSEVYDYRVCLSEDTDCDGLNNTVDLNSTDADIDDDGVPDGKELLWDQDSDGDTVINCLDADSDNDGITDGTEMGYVIPVYDCDIYNGTNTSKTYGPSRYNWTKDADPSTTTNPVSNDTDGDGLLDGWDDVNRNGQWDAGETKGESTVSGWDASHSYNGKVESDEADPNDDDSDDDGVGDGEEVQRTADTDGDDIVNCLDFDSDGDGLPDGLELGRINGCNGTDMDVFVPDGDPNSTTSMVDDDSDGDGLTDGFEDWNKNGILDWNETDPCCNDTDGDNITDGIEDDNANHIVDIDSGTNTYLETDPLNADTDGDGLDDGVEDANWDGIVDDTETDPRDPDTDSDGVSDGIEVRGWQVSVYFEATGEKKQGYPILVTSDPLEDDTDSDGLKDGYEYENATHPNCSDTDGDGRTDIQELTGDEPTDPCGFDGSPPNLTDLEISMKKIQVEILGITVTIGHELHVKVRAKDNFGVAWVEFKIKGQGSEKVYLPSGTYNDTAAADFETDWKKSLFTGYDLNISACDNNRNIGYLEKHIPSVLELVLEAILGALTALAEFIKELASAAINWIWEAFKSMAKAIVDPIMDAMGPYLNTLCQKVDDGFPEYQANGEVSGETEEGITDAFFGPSFWIIFGMFIVLSVMISIIKYFIPIFSWLLVAVLLLFLLVLTAYVALGPFDQDTVESESDSLDQKEVINGEETAGNFASLIMDEDADYNDSYRSMSRGLSGLGDAIIYGILFVVKCIIIISLFLRFWNQGDDTALTIMTFGLTALFMSVVLTVATYAVSKIAPGSAAHAFLVGASLGAAGFAATVLLYGAAMNAKWQQWENVVLCVGSCVISIYLGIKTYQNFKNLE